MEGREEGRVGIVDTAAGVGLETKDKFFFE